MAVEAEAPRPTAFANPRSSKRVSTLAAQHRAISRALSLEKRPVPVPFQYAWPNGFAKSARAPRGSSAQNITRALVVTTKWAEI